ncbi:protoporphyrinogen oxidase-like [Rhopilema esculentum]|uniref:protoporphyrinogen oxidase-like n=1 Tax=Rhopilema esculentum TaxID=499914 RepID=UPI0031CDCC80|eukprot:gene16436-7848_t
MSFRIGSHISNPQINIVILGGGISGLAAAHSAISSRKPGVSVTLLEAKPRYGGWVETLHYEDGCTFEVGPRTIRPVGLPGKRTLELVSELGLETKVIPVTRQHPSASKRYIYAKGRICLLPNSLVSLFTKQPPLTSSIVSSLIKEPFQTKSAEPDETVHSFFKRRVGSEIADYFADAFCHGIYASGSKELSVGTCFPSLLEYERRYGSLSMGALFSKKAKIPLDDCLLYKRSQKEKWSIWTLKDGLQGFVEAWSNYLVEKGLNTRLNTKCHSLIFSENNKVLCQTEDGVVEADHVISSLASKDLAALLPDRNQKLSNLLKKIQNVTVGVVNLEFEGKQLPVDGFGLLVPSCEAMDILGIVFDSCVVEDGRGNTKLTVMMGGSKYESLFGNPDNTDKDYLLHRALQGVTQTLGIKKKPIKCCVSIQKECIPQYQVGHLELVESIHTEICKDQLPLTIVGSSYRAVGINDCIFNAQTEVENIMNFRFVS